jgi:hypothetical protein
MPRRRRPADELMGVRQGRWPKRDVMRGYSQLLGDAACCAHRRFVSERIRSSRRTRTTRETSRPRGRRAAEQVEANVRASKQFISRKSRGQHATPIQAVARIRKPRKSPSANESATVTFSTHAMRGPDRQAAVIASTMDISPENTASTEPSRRLRTQPERPRAPASCATHAR